MFTQNLTLEPASHEIENKMVYEISCELINLFGAIGCQKLHRNTAEAALAVYIRLQDVILASTRPELVDRIMALTARRSEAILTKETRKEWDVHEEGGY